MLIGNKHSKINVALFYIPNEGSKYWYNTIMEDIENDIFEQQTKNDCPMFIMGDLNARTGLLKDCIQTDDACPDPNWNNTTNERYNQDKKTNNNGKALIEICNNLNLNIINGRFGADKNVGKFTCSTYNGSSTIDYILTSDSLLDKIKEFDIHDFDPCLSDVHSAVSCVISETVNWHAPSTYGLEKEDVYTKKLNKLNWNVSTQQHYENGFDIEEVNNINFLIEDLLSGDNTSTLNTDAIVEKINTLIVSTAEISGAITTNKPKHNKPTPRQPWFDSDCRRKKKEYKRFTRRSKLSPDHPVRKRISKDYKKFIQGKRQKFNSNLNEELSKLNSRNPKAYWDIIKKASRKNTNEKYPAVEELSKHFQKLNTNNEDNCFLPDNIPDNEYINDDITIKEIKTLISKLKNNKACGTDNIYAELIKNAPEEMFHLITNFFNLILNTGDVPEIWTHGIIAPIHKKGARSDPNNYRGITLLCVMGKLFTAVLNSRITSFLDATGTIGPEQAGFRAEYSTNDHIFVLHSLIKL